MHLKRKPRIAHRSANSLIRHLQKKHDASDAAIAYAPDIVILQAAHQELHRLIHEEAVDA